VPGGSPEPTGQTPLNCRQHRIGHLAKRPQWLMTVLPGAEVAFGQRVETSETQSVDQDGDLDPVAHRKRHRFEQFAAAGELTG
jgi:hypothetical protein